MEFIDWTKNLLVGEHDVVFECLVCNDYSNSFPSLLHPCSQQFVRVYECLDSYFSIVSLINYSFIQLINKYIYRPGPTWQAQLMLPLLIVCKPIHPIPTETSEAPLKYPAEPCCRQSVILEARNAGGFNVKNLQCAVNSSQDDNQHEFIFCGNTQEMRK